MSFDLIKLIIMLELYYKVWVTEQNKAKPTKNLNVQLKLVAIFEASSIINLFSQIINAQAIKDSFDGHPKIII